MKFLCLGYLDPQKMDSKPKAEIDAVMEKCWPLMDAMYKTGAVLVDAGLSPEAKHLRRVEGELLISDGPFAETKELIASAIVIEAENYDEAVKISALHPTTLVLAGEALGWRLEVRPIHYFKDFLHDK